MKLANFANRMRNLFYDKNRKSLMIILKEIIKLIKTDKALPFHYFIKFLYRKEVDGIEHYLNIKAEREIIRKCHRLTPELVDRIARNKLLFHVFSSKTYIQTPQLYGWNLEDNFYLVKDSQIYRCEKSEEFYQSIAEIIEQGNNVFFKPISGMGGKNCGKINAERLRNIDLKKFFSGGYIFESEVKQHHSVNQIYDKSLNTIRMITFYNRADKDLVFLAALMRFGVKGQPVDNASYGGMFVPVDLIRGELLRYGFSHLHFDGQKQTHHPDTGAPFEKFTIPYFNEAVELIKGNIEIFPGVLMGWDIGITPDGPVIIELNSIPGLMGADIVYGGLKKHPDFSKINRLVSAY